MITEIMVDMGNGLLPQWIELTNVSGADVSLDGWSVQITNSGADDDTIGDSVSINLMGTLGEGEPKPSAVGTNGTAVNSKHERKDNPSLNPRRPSTAIHSTNDL